MSIYSFSIAFGSYGVCQGAILLGWIVPSWNLAAVSLTIGSSLLLVHLIRRLP